MNVSATGSIEISVGVQNGRVAAVAITPRPQVPVHRLTAGLRASDLADLFPRLFALCGCAHQVAAMTAVEAARGEKASSDMTVRRMQAVLAERLVELLRGTLTGLDSILARDLAPAVHQVVKYGGSLALAAATSQAERIAAIAGIEAALASLALPPADLANPDMARQWLAVPGPLSRLVAQDFMELETPSQRNDGFLDVATDRRVGQELLAQGRSYSLLPQLDGRVPETGALARLGLRAADVLPPRLGSRGVRLLARLIEMAAIPKRMRELMAGQEPEDPDRVISGITLGAHTGVAAVECARGRLYHAVELDGDDHIARFEYVAPTEWNFHPRGSLARQLLGRPLADGDAGRRYVELLVAAFDPCVEFHVSVWGMADA